MKRSETIAEFAKAMAKFQETVEQPKKDKDNPFFGSKYVPFENIVEAINKSGPPQGLSFTQWAVPNENGNIGVATMVMHVSGEFIEYDPIFMPSEKKTAQGAGSVISYMKRYSLSAAYGMASEDDDDGNDASKKGQEQGQTPAQKAYEDNKAKKEKEAAERAKNENNGNQRNDQPKALSEGQRKMIWAKLKAIGEQYNENAEQAYDRIQKAYGTNVKIDQLTSARASKLISLLIEHEGGKQIPETP